jgi:hypothetical protein
VHQGFAIVELERRLEARNDASTKERTTLLNPLAQGVVVEGGVYETKFATVKKDVAAGTTYVN